MLLSDIVLESTTEEEFQRANRLWYGEEFQKVGEYDLARIKSAITAPSFEDLLFGFRENVFARELLVYEGEGNWLNIDVEDMRVMDIYRIAELAQKASKMPKKLELLFIPYNETYFKMRFAEFEGTVVGYEVIFPRSHWASFGWSKTPDLRQRSTIGVWTPER